MPARVTTTAVCLFAFLLPAALAAQLPAPACTCAGEAPPRHHRRTYTPAAAATPTPTAAPTAPQPGDRGQPLGSGDIELQVASEHGWEVTAPYGEVAADLVLTASARGASAPVEVHVSASPAMPLGRLTAMPLPLRLAEVDGASGATTASDLILSVQPGSSKRLRVIGTAPAIAPQYAAMVHVDGIRPRTYSLLIKSSWPLGLRSNYLAPPVREAVWPSRATITQCIPVQHAIDAYALNYQMRKPATESTAHLLNPTQMDIALHPFEDADGDAAAPACAEPAVWLRFRSLSAGEYVATMLINDEELAVRLLVQSPWYFVFIWILLGAAISTGVREWFRLRQAQSQNEEKISAMADRLEQTQIPVVWDHLRVQNALRKARGSNRWLGLSAVDAALSEAEAALKEPWTQVEEVGQALREIPLPQGRLATIDRDLKSLMRLSSAEDGRVIRDGLLRLATAAQRRFRAELSTWLSELNLDLRRTEAAVRNAAVPAALRPLFDHALRTIALLLEDAEELLAHTPMTAAAAAGGGATGALPPAALEQAHIELLDQVSTALSRMRAAAESAPGAAAPHTAIRQNLYRIMHAWLDAGPSAPSASSPPVTYTGSIGIRGRSSGGGDALRSLSPVTFELRLTSDEPRSYAVRWRIGADEIVGGIRLTYVFAQWRRFARLPISVEAELVDPGTGKALQPQSISAYTGALSAPDSSAWRSRTRAWIAEKSVTMVGVLLVAAIAVGVQWAGRPFGSLGDVMGLFAAGLGIDTVGGGAAGLLKQLRGSLGVDGGGGAR